jgi:hypothetical protein
MLVPKAVLTPKNMRIQMILYLPQSIEEEKEPPTPSKCPVDGTPAAVVRLHEGSLFLRRIQQDFAEACCSNDFLIAFPLSYSLVANLSI